MKKISIILIVVLFSIVNTFGQTLNPTYQSVTFSELGSFPSVKDGRVFKYQDSLWFDNGLTFINLSRPGTGGSGSMVYPGAGIALSTGSGWTISLTNNSSNWNTAYAWGNHSSAGYAKMIDTSGGSGNNKLASTYGLGLKQNMLISGTNIKTINGNSLLGSGDLTISGGGSMTWPTLAGIPVYSGSSSWSSSISNGTGWLHNNGSGTYTYSTPTNSDIGSQPALSGTGFVKISGTTISYDNSTYLTGNQSISLGGFLSGSGSTSIAAQSASKFIVQGTSDANLTGAQFLGSLSSGLVRNTTTTGVLTVLATGTSAQYVRGDLTMQTLNSTAVGLGNVNNTADMSKPVSTAQQAAINLKENYLGLPAGNNYVSISQTSGARSYAPITYTPQWNKITSDTTITTYLKYVTIPTYSFTDGAPTQAQIQSAVGKTASQAGAGFMKPYQDSDGTGLIYLIISDGTDYYFIATTKGI